MDRFRKVFTKLPSVIGMIHVRPLPGSPRYQKESVASIVDHAVREAELFVKGGVDAILIENMHDIPYMNRSVGPEITASMAAVAVGVRNICPTSTPCGLQILAGCNREAMAVAKATGLQFIRAEGFVFAHVGDEGTINSDAGELLRYRRAIDANDVLVLTDIKKKHSSHSITQDIDLTEYAKAAQFFLTDGVIVTGNSTGDPASPADVSSVVDNVHDMPVLVGSGVDSANVHQYSHAHALIVGSHFKTDGRWQNELSLERLEKFMERVNQIRDNA